MRNFLLLGLFCALSGCAGAEALRTSANTMIVDAGAAPACGAQGAAKVAGKVAAVETIKAGFDRYIITDAAARNNVVVTQGPGTYQTSGTVMSYGGGFGGYQGTTTYTPGPTIVAGRHNQSLRVVMFKKGDPGFDQAVDAKDMLGPEWEEIVKTGVHTCL